MQLYEKILGVEMDKPNFRRKFLRMKPLVDLGEKEKDVSHWEGPAQVEFILSPTLDFLNQGEQKFAVSVDDREPHVINMHTDTGDDSDTSVSNNSTRVSTEINLEPGNHTLKVWAIEIGVVLQKIIIWTGEEKDSYLGPPESAKAE